MQMLNVLVSVIMPCYNAERFIAAAIDSVLTQSHRNLELIIVNDGSTDQTDAIIRQYSDHRILYIKQEKMGQAAASNNGLLKASGDYIKFFDADDVLNATHIEEQVNKIEGRKDVLASCAWGRFYGQDPFEATFIKEPVWQDSHPLDWLKIALSQRADMMPAWLWLIPKELIQQTGGWREDLSLNNDFEFSVRLLLQASNVVFAEGAKVYYRSTAGGSLSSQASYSAYTAAILSNKLGCSYLLQHENTTATRRLCANRYQLWAYRIYPQYPLLVKELKKEIEQLGGSDLQLEGSKSLQLIASLGGWKTARYLQYHYYKFRKR